MLTTVALTGLMILPGTSLASTTWHVKVGAQSPDKGRQANFFFTREITVDVGDTVQWTDNADEIHTVTFLAGTPRPPLFTPLPPPAIGIAPDPQALGPAGGPNFDGSSFTSSGLMPGIGLPPSPFSLTFTKAGDFPYVCLVHATMNGIVHVQPAGRPTPKTQAQLDREARSQISEQLGEATELQAEGLDLALDAGRTQVTVGIGQLFNTGSLAVLRFEPRRKTIRAGQTVTWTNRDPETPHTITFGTEPPGAPFGAFAPAGTDGSGLAQSGHAMITSTTQSVNSGFILDGLPFGKTFKATFTTPGTYAYICALHDTLGMTGIIVVRPADSD